MNRCKTVSYFAFLGPEAKPPVALFLFELIFSNNTSVLRALLRLEIKNKFELENVFFHFFKSLLKNQYIVYYNFFNFISAFSMIIVSYIFTK